MASPKQLAANRRNAQRSTGPKSEEGRRRSAVNALSHGLSSPHRSAEDVQAMQTVALLIQEECGGAGQALELASKIIDYERNEARQREFLFEHLRNVLGPPKPPFEGRALEQAIREQVPEYSALQDLLGDELSSGVRPNKRKLAEVSRVLLRLKNEAMQERELEPVKALKRWQGSLRYLRRASNQLVKSVRAVTAR
jgi:hypothetical protein